MLPKNYKKPSSYKTTTRKKPVYRSKKLAAGGPGDPKKPVDGTETPLPGNVLPVAEVVAYNEGLNPARLTDHMAYLNSLFSDPKSPYLNQPGKEHLAYYKEDTDQFPLDYFLESMTPYSTFKRGKVSDPTQQSWSAATTSYLMGQLTGAESREDLLNRGFRAHTAHYPYINAAFETKKDPNFEFNSHIAKRIPNSLKEVKIGDLFFRGYDRTDGYSYKDFKKLAKTSSKEFNPDTEEGGYYPSHTDTVVDKGTDDKGDYVVLSGGNVKNRLLYQKVYLDNIKDDYAGYMQQNPERNFEDSRLFIRPNVASPSSDNPSEQDFNPLILPTFGMAAGGNLMTNGYMNVLAAGGEMTEGDPTSPSTSTNSLTEQEKNLILDSIKKAAPGIGEYQMQQIYDNFFADEDSIPYTRNMLISDKLDETVQLVLGSRLASKALSGEKPRFSDIVSTLAGAQGDIKTALINMGVPPEQAVEYLKAQARQAGAPEENLGYIDRLGGKGLLNPFNFFDYELPADKVYYSNIPHYSFAAGGNMYAMGGPQDMLTNIENGGTHEENPLGGVPMGPNASVEQGETIQRNTEPGTDFVFSDRLPEKGITKEMAAEYNLPKNMVGKTFAQASKTIEKQNHRKHDLIDKNTKDVALARLRDAQEEYKDRAFREQLAEIEDKFGKSAAEAQQPSPEEQAMMQQQMQGAAQPAQPSPEEMMAMQMGMGQEPPQGIPAPPAQMPGQPMGQPMASQMAPEGMDPNREAQIRAALQNAYGGPVQMAPGGPTTQDLLRGLGNYEQVLYPNGAVDRQRTYGEFAKDVFGLDNLQRVEDFSRGMMPSGIPYADPDRFATGPRVDMSPQPTVDSSQINSADIQEAMMGMGIDPMQASTPVLGETMPGMTPVDFEALSSGIPFATPAGPRNELGPEIPEKERSVYDILNSMEGFDPVTYFQTPGLDYRVPIEMEEMPTLPTQEQFTTQMPIQEVPPKTEGFKDFDPNEWLEEGNKGGENEYVDRYRQGVFADAYAKLLQSIKPIRERNAAAYFINAQYDPINYPIEAQRKALKDISSSTRRLLANRMGSSPGMYMAMMGKINADEALQTADLFDKKYTAEAQDVQRIRELNNQNSEFNMRMKQLVEELNEKDLQGKEQLALEAANSFAKTYQGLRKEDFMKFLAEEYKILYGLTGGGDFLEEEDKDKEDKEDNKD